MNKKNNDYYGINLGSGTPVAWHNNCTFPPSFVTLSSPDDSIAFRMSGGTTTSKCPDYKIHCHHKKISINPSYFKVHFSNPKIYLTWTEKDLLEWMNISYQVMRFNSYFDLCCIRMHEKESTLKISSIFIRGILRWEIAWMSIMWLPSCIYYIDSFSTKKYVERAMKSHKSRIVHKCRA